MERNKPGYNIIPFPQKDARSEKEKGDKQERRERATAFIDEIVNLSNQYGLSLYHEEIGGGFEVVDYNKRNIDWLRDARVR